MSITNQKQRRLVHEDVDGPHGVRQMAPCPMRPTPRTRCGPWSSALCQWTSIALGCPAAPGRDLFKERRVEWSSEQLQDCPCCTGVSIARKAQASSCACARRSDGPRLLPPVDRACRGFLGEVGPAARGPPHRSGRLAHAPRRLQTATGRAVAGRVQPVRRRPPREAAPPRPARRHSARPRGACAVPTAPRRCRPWPRRRAPTARGPPQQRWVAAVPLMHLRMRRPRVQGCGQSRWRGRSLPCGDRPNNGREPPL